MGTAPAARADQTSDTQQQVNQIQQQINDMQAVYQSAAAKTQSTSADLAAQQGQVAGQTATYLALQTQQEDAEAAAVSAKRQAGAVAARLSRSGQLGDASIALEGGNAQGTLNRLSSLGRIGEQAATVYSTAIAEANAAQQLAKQAKRAQSELARQADALTKANQDAASAQAQLQKSLQDQQSHAADLARQLAVLQKQDADKAAAAAAALVQQRQAAAEAAQRTAAQQANAAAQNAGSQYTQKVSQQPSSPAPAAPARPAAPATPAAPAAPAGNGGGSSTGSSSQARAAQLIAYGMQYLGRPYVWGTAGPLTFDCSGYTQFVYGHVGVGLVHSSDSQRYAGRPSGSPQAGDLIWWPGHVAIYIGGGMTIQAVEPGVGTARVSVSYVHIAGGPVYRDVL
ncbi:MAG: C40 family peptidase [Pseudoclavibacter sp.]|jgi:cell wall-associated NlpC family hydrolase